MVDNYKMGLVARELNLDALTISPRNVRIDFGDVDDLVASVTDYGVLEPIVVRPMGEGYEVLIGSRRVAAARRAGHTTIPSLVVDDVTDAQATLFSLIENLKRKDLTLSERVAGYKALLDLEPSFTYQRLAQAIGVPHQKISQDLQAYEMQTRLMPYSISVASNLQPGDERRQRGELLPEYHAVLLHQALPYLDEYATGTGGGPDGALAVLARKIAPMGQFAARAYITSLKDGSASLDDPAGEEDEAESITPWHQTGHQHSQSQPGTPEGKGRQDGGVVICAYCDQAVTILHTATGTHQVKRQSLHQEN
jgi:ParB/RepB/Spo0J family partition protein